MRRSEPLIAVLGAAAGVVCAIFLDPRSGRRRRAITRDKIRHYLRLGSFQGRRRARHLAGPIRGLPHRIVNVVPLVNHAADVDSTELKHRVESQLGRDATLPLSAINIDAVDGVIRVRGVAPDSDQARRIVERAARVGGVKGVLSLMHTAAGWPAGGTAGKGGVTATGEVANARVRRLRQALLDRWPWLTEQDVLATRGRPESLCGRIAEREHLPEHEIRAALDEVLLAQIDPAAGASMRR